MDKPVFRFAPSPNGELHLGHAFSALVGYERACAAGGRFLVRIEDIDKGRARARYVASILADLAWLGVAWEEPVVFQSRRLPAYRAQSERLERIWADGGYRGKLVNWVKKHFDVVLDIVLRSDDVKGFAVVFIFRRQQ